MKRIYKLEWYLEREGLLKTKWMSSRKMAEREFEELKKVLKKDCWISIDEYVERCEEEGFEYGMQIGFTEI